MGVGHVDAKLLRGGGVLASGSLAISGRITFNDVQQDDTIAVVGACTGSTHLAIDVQTNPPTPVDYIKGNIFDSFDIV
jgi:hypothetical protein